MQAQPACTCKTCLAMMSREAIVAVQSALAANEAANEAAHASHVCFGSR